MITRCHDNQIQVNFRISVTTLFLDMHRNLNSFCKTIIILYNYFMITIIINLSWYPQEHRFFVLSLLSAVLYDKIAMLGLHWMNLDLDRAIEICTFQSMRLWRRSLGLAYTCVYQKKCKHCRLIHFLILQASTKNTKTCTLLYILRRLCVS